MTEFRSRLGEVWNYYRELGLSSGQYNTDSGYRISEPQVYPLGVEAADPAVNRLLQKVGKSAEIVEVDKQYMGNIAGMTIIENFNDVIKIWLRKGLGYLGKRFVTLHEIAHHIVRKYEHLLIHDEIEDTCDRIAFNELNLAYRPI